MGPAIERIRRHDLLLDGESLEVAVSVSGRLEMITSIWMRIFSPKNGDLILSFHEKMSHYKIFQLNFCKL